MWLIPIVLLAVPPSQPMACRGYGCATMLHRAECATPPDAARMGAALDAFARRYLPGETLMAQAFLRVAAEQGAPVSDRTRTEVEDAVARMPPGDGPAGDYRKYQKASLW